MAFTMKGQRSLRQQGFKYLSPMLNFSQGGGEGGDDPESCGLARETTWKGTVDDNAEEKSLRE